MNVTLKDDDNETAYLYLSNSRGSSADLFYVLTSCPRWSRDRDNRKLSLFLLGDFFPNSRV